MSTRSRSSLGVTLVLALLAPASSALAWPTVDPSGNQVPVLRGRWTVALPEDTLRAAATQAPNAPAAREELDSAAVVRTPEGNLAIRGVLLESTRPDDLAAAVRTLPAPCPSPTYGTLGERTDLVAVRCTEASPDGALRPLSVYAVHPDGWVDRIEAMVETTDPDDEAARTAGIAYAEAVMATLTPGPAPDAVERGTIEIARACEADGAADRLTITLPDGWIAMRDTMGTTELVRLTHVVPLGSERPMLAIELSPAGSEPPRVPEGVGALRAGAILGSPVDWLVIEDEGQPTSVRQVAAELTVDCGGDARYARALRLSLGGPRATVDEGQRILEALTLGSTRGHTAELTAVSSQAPAIDESALDEGSDEDRAAAQQGHFWSIAIGGASLLLLAAALVMRGRTTRPK